MYFKPDNLFACIAPVTLQYELKKRPYDFYWNNNNHPQKQADWKRKFKLVTNFPSHINCRLYPHSEDFSEKLN